jgi:PilZ domain
MQIGHKLNGRVENRLPIIVVVRLSPALDLSVGEELTHTDNVSKHGARVVSSHSWQLGEQANIAPLKEGPSMRGEVVYCQGLSNRRFCVGFRFQESLTWSVLSRYDGM